MTSLLGCSLARDELKFSWARPLSDVMPGAQHQKSVEWIICGSPAGWVGCHVIQCWRMSLSLYPTTAGYWGGFGPVIMWRTINFSQASLLGWSLAAVWCLFVLVLLQIPNMVFDQRLLGNFFQDLTRNDNSEAESSKTMDVVGWNSYISWGTFLTENDALSWILKYPVATLFF